MDRVFKVVVAGSWSSFKSRSLNLLFTDRTSHSIDAIRRSHANDLPWRKINYGHYSTQRWLHMTRMFQVNNKMETSDSKKFHTQVPSPDHSNSWFPNWGRWILGPLLFVLFPFCNFKRRKLLLIGSEAEMVMEQVENVAEVVEEVATVAEKAAGEVADKLPDHNKLKEVASVVEHISKMAAQDAHLTQDFIHKVDAVKHDVNALEKIVEPLLFEKIADPASGAKPNN